MNVSSATNSQQNPYFNDNKNSENMQASSPVVNYMPAKVNPVVDEQNNYYMKSLDERGNMIMNKLLAERPSSDRWITQAILDRSFSRSIKINSSGDIEVVSNSNFKAEDDILAMVDEFIQNKKTDTEVDKFGTLDVARQFKALYMTSYLPMDMKA